MNIELRPIDSVQPYDQNPRRNDDAVAAVARSLKEFGWRQPVVVDKDNVIVVGHTRWKAAKQLGMTEIPVHVAHELTPEQAKAYRLADNQTATIAEWDMELLPVELAELKDLGVDLLTLGWSSEELTEIMAPPGNVGLTDPDEIPQPPAEAITKPGDLWILGEHRLLCGDSSKPEDVDRLLGGQVIHVVNTDPPYNVKVEPRSDIALASGLKGMPGGGQYDKIRTGTLNKGQIRPKDRRLDNDFRSDEDFERFMTGVVSNIGRTLVPGRAFYVWCGAFPSNAGGPANTESFPKLFRDMDLRYAQMIVWDKGHGILGRKDFMTQYEVCLYGWKSGSAHEFFGPNNVTDLWSVKRLHPSQMEHLTAKPVELAARAMAYSSKPGENVLDLFGGSGSTLIAAEQQGRRAFLMEIDTLYCDVVCSRYQRYSGKPAVLARTGESPIPMGPREEGMR